MGTFKWNLFRIIHIAARVVRKKLKGGFHFFASNCDMSSREMRFQIEPQNTPEISRTTAKKISIAMGRIGTKNFSILRGNGGVK